jgi:hypothetical protein
VRFRKKIWDDDEIIKLSLLKSFKKNTLSTVSSFYNGKMGIEALINTIENKEPLPGNPSFTSIRHLWMDGILWRR